MEPIVRGARRSLGICALYLCACGGFSTGTTGSPDDAGSSGATGGVGHTGGAHSSGAAGASGGVATGGRNGGSTGGGGTNAGGAIGRGGALDTGGAIATGGTSTGGAIGTGGSSTGGASTGGAAGTGGTLITCQPILNQANLDTGFESCSDGSKRRRAALVCPTERTTTTSPCTSNPTCKSDSDCNQQPNGYCADAHNLAGYCGCYYGCRQDSDCDAGSVCECGVVVGHCVSASCKTSADCGAGYGCVGTIKGIAGTVCNNTYPTPPAQVYVCQSTDDLCSGDKDCPPGGSAQARCLFDGNHLACGLVCLPTP